MDHWQDWSFQTNGKWWCSLHSDQVFQSKLQFVWQHSLYTIASQYWFSEQEIKMYQLAIVCTELQDPKFGTTLTLDKWIRAWMLLVGPQSKGPGGNQIGLMLSWLPLFTGWVCIGTDCICAPCALCMPACTSWLPAKVEGAEPCEVLPPNAATAGM